MTSRIQCTGKRPTAGEGRNSADPGLSRRNQLAVVEIRVREFRVAQVFSGPNLRSPFRFFPSRAPDEVSSGLYCFAGYSDPKLLSWPLRQGVRAA